MRRSRRVWSTVSPGPGLILSWTNRSGPSPVGTAPAPQRNGVLATEKRTGQHDTEPEVRCGRGQASGRTDERKGRHCSPGRQAVPTQRRPRQPPPARRRCGRGQPGAIEPAPVSRPAMRSRPNLLRPCRGSRSTHPAGQPARAYTRHASSTTCHCATPVHPSDPSRNAARSRRLSCVTARAPSHLR